MPLLTERLLLVDADATSAREELFGRAAFVSTNILVNRLRKEVLCPHGETLPSSVDVLRPALPLSFPLALCALG